ncbi:MAG: toprim domain-containing protein [Gammaproteobacteria bacterium]|jgi:putative DNA primase/helicase|nr:toprim domain-containing protein [Gammaproteobacteria bacterium]
MSNYVSNFREAMIEHGFEPPSTVYTDGKLHRFSNGSKKGDKPGWYILYGNGQILTGIFNDWRRGGRPFIWHPQDPKKILKFDLLTHKAKLKRIITEEKIKIDKRHEQASYEAKLIWDSLGPADPNHPYLVKKRINPFIGRQKCNCLVYPITDFNGRIWSLQFIYPDSNKRFRPTGCNKKGKFVLLQEGSSRSRILIPEGIATGATLAQDYPDSTVIAALDAGNLEPVAVGARWRYPSSKIVVCADDDKLNPYNPGINKGRKAALAANAYFSRPQWPEDAPESLSDFNDLACWLASKQESL